MEFAGCLLVTTAIGICFKLFGQWKVNTFNAIVINYTVCLTLGTLLDPDVAWPFSREVIGSPWFRYVILLGGLFITGFNITAYAVQKAGITLTTLMQKMSILITVAFAVISFHEHFGTPEIIGFVLAILAILAINQKGKSLVFKHHAAFTVVLFLVLLFAAAIEITLFYVEKTGLVGQQQMAFTTHGFGCAAVLGWVILGWRFLTRAGRLTLKDAGAGLLLGIPNYFSIYLLLIMLNQGWKGSILYPLLNVSVLILSTGIAVLAFHEKLTRVNWMGIAFAILAIMVIAYAHNIDSWKTVF